MRNILFIVLGMMIALILWTFAGLGPEGPPATDEIIATPRSLPSQLSTHASQLVVDTNNVDRNSPVAQCPDQMSLDDVTAQQQRDAIFAAATKTPPYQITDAMIDNICVSWDVPRRTKVPRLFYALMFGYEVEMLSIVLHEVTPVADVVFITESTVTHSLSKKPLLWQTVADKPPFDRYSAMRSNVSSKAALLSHHVFRPSRQYKSGWDIEKRQRGFFLRFLKDFNVSAGDIIVGNIDLDEILTRETLIAMKYCQVKSLEFSVVHFRYHMNCLQDRVFNTYYTTVFYYEGPQSTKIDLYSRRRMRNTVRFNVSSDAMSGLFRRHGAAWHLTAFGGPEAVLLKYKNSPHRFVAELSRKDVIKNIQQCIYNHEPRVKITPKPGEDVWYQAKPESKSQWNTTPLPYLMAENFCVFKKIGWL